MEFNDMEWLWWLCRVATGLCFDIGLIHFTPSSFCTPASSQTVEEQCPWWVPRALKHSSTIRTGQWSPWKWDMLELGRIFDQKQKAHIIHVPRNVMIKSDFFTYSVTISRKKSHSIAKASTRPAINLLANGMILTVHLCNSTQVWLQMTVGNIRLPVTSLLL